MLLNLGSDIVNLSANRRMLVRLHKSKDTLS